MTVCYGFVCRRREILNFMPGDRNDLSKILSSGRSSAAAERVAVQKAVMWFDRRMGPIIGTDRRVANADIRAFDDKAQFRLLGYHSQHDKLTTRSARVGASQISRCWRSTLPR